MRRPRCCRPPGQRPLTLTLTLTLTLALALPQASWKRRSVQGKFQSAVGELMEINGLIEGISDVERDLEERQNFTALKIEKAISWPPLTLTP